MSTTAQTSELMVVTSFTAVQLFEVGAPEKILEKIRTEARIAAEQLDISTETGRKAIASLAYKVARTKTFLDDQGKELVADLKKQSGAIDAERKKFRDELDALKDEVRKPLTEFEDAEKTRVADHEAALGLFANEQNAAHLWKTSAEIKEHIHAVEELFALRHWQEFGQRAAGEKAVALAALNKALADTQHGEAEQAELARLRAEQAERERKERDERIAREATEKAEREAQEKAAAAELAARAEQERVERESREREAAIQRDKEAAERREKEAAERIEQMRVEAERAEARRKQEAIDAERRAKEAAEAATRAERERAERERLAAEEETRKREANKKHRAKIDTQAADAIASLGVSAEQSDIIIAAIAAGKVPHVRIEY